MAIPQPILETKTTKEKRLSLTLDDGFLQAIIIDYVRNNYEDFAHFSDSEIDFIWDKENTLSLELNCWTEEKSTT